MSIKKIASELQTLVNKYGYWSDEVYKFNNSLDYDTMIIVNNKIVR